MWFRGFVLFSAAIVFTELYVASGYVSLAEVPVENGECNFNGTKIAPQHPLHLEQPCEMWSCRPSNGESGHLSIEGCGVVRGGPGCTVVNGTGVYPDCCKKVICN